MPETSAFSTVRTSAGRSALRIVLFGMPDAGKSSLLGALAQAAQVQARSGNFEERRIGSGNVERDE